jgi:hypothetical protein
MGDRCSIKLVIGGRINPSTIPLLEKAIEKENPENYEPIQSCIEKKKVLRLYFHEINYGQLPTLEEVLIDNKIEFDLFQGGGREYDPEYRGFRKRIGAFQTSLDGEGNPTITYKELNNVRSLLKKKKYKKATQEMEKLLQKIPKLSPLSCAKY